MKKGILAALAGISALLIGGLLLVTWVERPGPAQAGASPAPVVLPAPPALVPAPAPQPPGAAVAPAALATAEPPRPRDIAELHRSLEPLRREVIAGLASLASRVYACKLQRNDFQVSLESLDGRVRILEAMFAEPDPSLYPPGVELPPPESPAAMACVKGAMQGVVLSAPSARPGRSWQQAWTDRADP